MSAHVNPHRRLLPAALFVAALLHGQSLLAQTGPFTAPSGPFLANGLPGVVPNGTTQVDVDTTGDGLPDHPYDLPPEIRPGSGYNIQYRLSPSRDVLISRKFTNGVGVVPGCSDPWDNRVWFHRLQPAPATGMTAFTGDQGACIRGPIAQGPWFYDPSLTACARTALIVGAPIPSATPTHQQILWADLVFGEMNLDSSTYDYALNTVQFAPGGNAAFIQSTSPFSFNRRYYLIDLCKSRIAGTPGLSTGPLPISGAAAARITTSGGEFFAQITINSAMPAYRVIPLLDCCSQRACCLGTGTCTLANMAGCEQQGGTPLSATDCGQVNCALPVGACCDGQGGCTVTTQAECTGAYQGDGSACPHPACDVPPPPAEACCLSLGECIEVTAAECAGLGGVNQPGQSCSGFACPLPEGTQACCTPSFGCVNLPTQSCVNFFGGIPQGEGTNCFANATCPRAVLTITKTAPETVSGGDVFTYMINYGNFGPDPSANVEIRETLPTGTTLIQASDAPGGIAPSIAGGVITWAIGTLPAGTVNQILTISVRAACSVPNNQIVNNNCRITGTPGGNVLAPAVITAVTPPASFDPVDITVSSADVNGGALFSNDLIQHIITLTNTGPATAANVQVTNAFGNDISCGVASLFEAVLDAAGGQFTVSVDNRSFRWTGDVPGSGVRTLIFTTRIEACTFATQEVLNHGQDIAVRSVCGGTLGQVTPADAFPLTRAVVAEIEALNLNAPQPANAPIPLQLAHAGSTLEFEIRLIEQGGASHDPVVASLPLPAGITADPLNNPLISAPPGAAYDAGTRTIHYVGPLNAGQAVSIRWNGIVSDGDNCDALRQFLTLTGSVDGCSNLTGNLRLLILSPAPAPPYLIGGDRLGTIYALKSQDGPQLEPLICLRAEILTGLGRGPNGDIWTTDAVHLARFNASTNPPLFQMVNDEFLQTQLQITFPFDVAVDPLDGTGLVVGYAGGGPDPERAVVRRYDFDTGQITFVLDDVSLRRVDVAVLDNEHRLVMITFDKLIRIDLDQPMPVMPGTHTTFNVEMNSDLGGLPGQRSPAVPVNVVIAPDGDYLVTVVTVFVEDFGDPFSLPLRHTLVYSLLKLDRDNPLAAPEIVIERLAGRVVCAGSCPGQPPDVSDAVLGGAEPWHAAAVRTPCEFVLAGRPYSIFGVYPAASPGAALLGSGASADLSVEDLLYVPGPGGVLTPFVGDFDEDCDVDLDDFEAFRTCAARSNVPLSPACSDQDLDGDTDGDLADFGRLQRCLFGPGNPARSECLR